MEAVLFISVILGIWLVSQAARDQMAGRENELRPAETPPRILRAAQAAAPELRPARTMVAAGRWGRPIYSVEGPARQGPVRVVVAHDAAVLAVERLVENPPARPTKSGGAAGRAGTEADLGGTAPDGRSKGQPGAPPGQKAIPKDKAARSDGFIPTTEHESEPSPDRPA